MEGKPDLQTLLRQARALGAEAQQHLARFERNRPPLGEIVRLLGISSAMYCYIQLPLLLGQELAESSEEQFLCRILRILVIRLRRTLRAVENVRQDR